MPEHSMTHQEFHEILKKPDPKLVSLLENWSKLAETLADELNEKLHLTNDWLNQFTANVIFTNAQPRTNNYTYKNTSNCIIVATTQYGNIEIFVSGPKKLNDKPQYSRCKTLANKILKKITSEA